MASSPEAEAAKAAGNAAFKAGNYALAIEHYTACISLDDSSAIFFSNRSIARCKLNKHAEAVADAERCIEIDPSWPKGYIRKATAQRATGDVDESKQTLEAGLAAVPGDVLLQHALASIEKEQLEIKGDVVDFAVNKTAAETALKGGNYAQAESSYASSLKVMEAMLDKLPPDKAAEIQAKLVAVRQNMKAELGTKTAEGN